MSPVHNPMQNLLPFDGIVRYFGRVIDPTNAAAYLEMLKTNLDWQQEETIIFGKRHISKRLVAWYGDESYEYRYSGSIKLALPWTKDLAALKSIAEKISGTIYNSCLVNLYHNGNEGMGWHSDNEKSIVPDSSIASISLGAERRFVFKHRTLSEKVEIFLQDGSILEMKGETQRYWLHSLPKSKRVTMPRINLTFRKMI